MIVLHIFNIVEEEEGRSLVAGKTYQREEGKLCGGICSLPSYISLPTICLQCKKDLKCTGLMVEGNGVGICKKGITFEIFL